MENFSMFMFSKEGQNAMKENNITLEDVKDFSEGDIIDLFKQFKDRMYARKLCAGLEDKSTPNSSQSGQEFSSAESMEFDAEELPVPSTSKHDDVEHKAPATNSYNKYSVDNMLAKKRVRSKGTDAQKFVRNLLKDAARAAKLWSPPAKTLTNISDRRRTIFHDILEKAEPSLKYKRQETWKCLGETLQNRRKYINDLGFGKRKLKKSPETQKSLDSYIIGTADQFKAGEEVKILNRQKIVLGKGIYLKVTGTELADIVLKSKTEFGEKGDYELPDGSYLKDTSLKAIITCNTNDLVSCTQKQFGETAKKSVGSRRKRELPIIQDDNSSNSDDGSDVELVDTAESTDTKPAKEKAAKNINAGPKGSRRKMIRTIRTDVDVQSDVNATESNFSKQKSETRSKARKNAAQVRDFRSIVLMEWSRGNIFWGIKKVVDLTDDFFIFNASKPSGRIVDGALDFDSVYLNSNGKLNIKDKQLNPNMDFCLWEVKKDNDIITLKDDTFEVITSKDKFIEKLKLQFEMYIKDT